MFFFFNDTATTEIYTLSLHDALPIFCMCQYTSSGHCGIVKDKTVDNDTSIYTLSKIAESHAAAGSDIVAPSAMMDGDRKSTRLNSSHANISYAVFCLKKKKK